MHRRRSSDSSPPRNTPLPRTSPAAASRTSLPSIRQLHPYLPPSGMSQHFLSGGEPSGSSSYPYPPPPPQFMQHEQQPSGSQREPEGYGGADSDMDETDAGGPPKKKRRRQALSCTGKFRSLLLVGYVPHFSVFATTLIDYPYVMILHTPLKYSSLLLDLVITTRTSCRM